MGLLVTLNGDELYRRLSIDQVELAPKTAVARKNAYYHGKYPDGEISVHVKRVAESVDELLKRAGRTHFGMGVLQVAEVKALGLDVVPADTPEDPAHAHIVGCNSKKLCAQLAAITEVIRRPKPKPKPSST